MVLGIFLSVKLEKIPKIPQNLRYNNSEIKKEAITQFFFAAKK